MLLTSNRRSRLPGAGVYQPKAIAEPNVELQTDLIVRAQSGDLEAFGQLVSATQTMAYAVARGVLRDSGLAEDAVQEAYLRAFRRLRDLEEPAAFAGWLRRIVITIALNMRRARRFTLLQLDDLPDVPVLDDEETSWSDLQRRRLAGALLRLTSEERQVCDRRYHGHWSTARLAHAAGIDEAAMRKRLQRIRDKLRKEMEVSELKGIRVEDVRQDFPAKIVELLARPQLTDLPENPVGKVLELLRTVYADFTERDLPEIVDFAEARKTIGDEALYVEPQELHHVDQDRILRYDLTLPLLLTVRYEGRPLRVWATGKAYRLGKIDSMHLDAFHQAEALYLDERTRLDPWRVTGQVLQSVDLLFPGRAVKMVPTQYAMCSQAWELEVEADGQWFEVLAWGVFTDKIVRHLGGDPAVHTAIGVGHGLERLAMLRYGIDDIRKIEVASVA
jgi:RNA polymerase sigma factor (sigma-70 family)